MREEGQFLISSLSSASSPLGSVVGLARMCVRNFNINARVPAAHLIRNDAVYGKNPSLCVETVFLKINNFFCAKITLKVVLLCLDIMALIIVVGLSFKL